MINPVLYQYQVDKSAEIINDYNYILIERDTNLPANYLDLRYYTGNADLNVWGNQWTPSTLFPIGGTAYEGNRWKERDGERFLDVVSNW